MRKIFIIVLLILLLLSANHAAAQLQVGISSGMTMSKIKGAEFGNLDLGHQRGYSIGVVLDIFLSDYAAIYCRPGYLQKGVNIDTVVPFLGDIDGHATLTYLDIPVTIKFVYTEDWYQPYLFAGPSIGILLGSKFEGVANGQRIDEDIDEVTGKIDIGLSGGGGIGFDLGDMLLFLDGRYTIGYSDILEDGIVVVEGEEQQVLGDAENRNYEVTAGIKFTLWD